MYEIAEILCIKKKSMNLFPEGLNIYHFHQLTIIAINKTFMHLFRAI